MLYENAQNKFCLIVSRVLLLTFIKVLSEPILCLFSKMTSDASTAILAALEIDIPTKD